MVWTSANGPKCPVSPEDRDEFMEPRDVRAARIEECAKIAADFAAYEQTVLDRAHADDALSDTGRKSIVAAAGSRQVAAEQIEHDIRALLV